MTTYNNVFGEETIPSSIEGYATYSLTGDTQFYWPEVAATQYLVADILDIYQDSDHSIIMPPANQVSVGRTVIISNQSAFILTIKDNGGNIIGSVQVGAVKCLYLTDNSTVTGLWNLIVFGTGTTIADATALVGYGLKVIGATLAQNYPTTVATTTATLTLADRAATRIFTASGAIICNLPAALGAGDGWFVNITNQGTGNVVVTPNGAETVDGGTTKTLSPGESATFVCTLGVAWVTVGYGRSTVFQFTKLVLDISSGSPFTIDSTQAQNKLLTFVGIATASVVVNVPSVVAVYYLQCSYSGAFGLTIKTASGTGVLLANTDRAIVYCDGVNVVLAQTSAVPATNIAGGVAGQVVVQVAPSNTGFSDLGLITNGYTPKASPVDADALPIYDSEASAVPKKLTWANLKASVFSAWGSLVAAATSKATPADADSVALSDSAASNATKKLTMVNLKAFVRSYMLATKSSWTSQQTPPAGTLTDAASVTWDGDTNGQSVKLTTTAARAFAAPTNIVEDNLYVLRLTTGGFTPSGWNAAYKWPSGGTPSSLSSGTYVFTFIGGAGNILIPTGPGYLTGA